jgi:hypothetical protein
MRNGKVPTFDDTAAFFEARAKKARNVDRQRELADAARFYRALARITLYFPYGYKAPELTNGASDRLSKHAEECKAIAAATRDPECRAKLLRLAATYEQGQSDRP